ncbi:hypothetical protein ACIQXD_09470 [Streptomyces uncialis]|uniref:hypothetical protein n=1 Tax=Streptomyces uncialis TaxID=1048205 RepID=UPI0037F49FA3
MSYLFVTGSEPPVSPLGTGVVDHPELRDRVKDLALFLAVSEQDVPRERDLFCTKPAPLPVAWDPAAH